MSEREKDQAKIQHTQAKVTSTYKPKNCNTHSDFPRQVQTMVNVYFVTVYYLYNPRRKRRSRTREWGQEEILSQAGQQIAFFIQ